MTRKRLLDTAYSLHIASFFAPLLALAIYYLEKKHPDLLYLQTMIATVSYIFFLGVLVLWIGNLIVWRKHDGDFGRFLALLFFAWIYSPIYYTRARKNEWV